MNELEEISRLRGELSTCCAVLGLLINAVSMNNPDTLAAFRRRITDWPMDIVDDPYWREGVNRFKNRLLEGFLRDNA